MLEILLTTPGPDLEDNIDEDEVDKKPEETLNLTGRLVDLQCGIRETGQDLNEKSRATPSSL